MPAIRKAWLRRLVLALASVGVAVALAYLIAPAIARWRLHSWLVAHGEQRVRIEDVDFNLFTLSMTVHTLVAEGRGEARLGWKRVDLEVGFWPLWKRRIEVQQLALENAVISVELSPEGNLTVGGLELGPSTGWEVGLANVDLHDVRLDYHGPQLSQQVTVVNARIDHLKTWQPQVPTHFQLELRTAGGTLRLEGRAEPLGRERSTMATVQIQELPVGWLGPLVSHAGLRQVHGVVHANLDVATQTGAKGAFHARLLGEVGATGLRAATAAQQVGADSLTFKGKVELGRASGAQASTLTTKGTVSAAKLTSTAGAAGPALAIESLSWTGTLETKAGATRAGGDLEATGAALADHASGRELARVDTVAADTLNLGKNKVGAATLRLRGVHLLQRPPAKGEQVDPEPAFVATSPEMTARNLEVQPPARVVLDTLRIEGLTADVIRGPEGKLEPLELLPKPAKPGGKPAPPWSAAVSEATLGGETNVSFRDLSVEPNVVLHLSKLRVKLSRIDSAEPKQASPLTMRTQIGKYSRLGTAGTISPFGPKLTADLGADVASLSLPPLNGYIGELIGYKATSGRLDMKLRLGVRGGKIDATAHATLRQFQVEPLPRTAAYRKLSEELPMPLPNALSLLRGANGDITLELPISGDLSAPKVNFSGVVRTAVANALKRGALVLFAPLGAAVEVRKLAGRLTSLRFNPVTFPPGSDSLPPAAQDYLTKMATILHEHPDTRVVLCGKAVEEDRRALAAAEAAGRASAPKGEKGGSGGGKQPASAQGAPVTKQALLALATKRAAAVKGFLVAHGVAAERLYLCAPELDEKPGAEPRVEMSA